MADKDGAQPAQKPAAGAAPATDAAAKAPKGNPAFRMMGLPNFRFKLPSRNWLIFLSITGAWTGAVLYDRREKKRRQQKWCDLVSHLSRETIPTSQMPRRLTIFLAAPPADGLMRAREHFHEYVKPVLVASGVDWDVIEGRREGDVRAGLAERIRNARKRNGEESATPLEESTENTVWDLRSRSGVKEWDGVQGDVVIGRHVWKEYVRGLHEGWLGPLDAPPDPNAGPQPLEVKPIDQQELRKDELEKASEEIKPAGPITTGDIFKDPPTTNDSDATPPSETSTPATADPSTPEAPAEEKKEEEPQPKKKVQPSPFISTADYSTAQLSQYCPPLLGPSTTVPYPHLLGFFNFPIRIYRFLTRRYLADEVGRATAAAALGTFIPYGAVPADIEDDASAATVDSDVQAGHVAEQKVLLKEAEKDWHKSVRERREKEPEKETVWLNDMVLDPRIAERMRRFVVEDAEERRADRIAKGEEKPLSKREDEA